MFKRIIIFIISLLLTFSILSACGEKSGGVTDETIEVAESQTTAENHDRTAGIHPPEDTTGAGRNTVAAEFYGKETTGSLWTTVVYSEGRRRPAERRHLLRLRAVEEELNLKISLYPLTNILTELTKTVSAGEDAIDFGMATVAYISPIMNKGLVIDLKTLPYIDFSHSWWDKNLISELEILGKLRAATGDISLYNDYAAITYFFNKHLHESPGLNLTTLSGSGATSQSYRDGRRGGDGPQRNVRPDIEDSFGMLLEPYI